MFEGGMDMIVLLAKSTLQEGKQQDFLAVAEKLVKATREEPGCLYYDLVQDALILPYFFYSGFSQ